MARKQAAFAQPRRPVPDIQTSIIHSQRGVLTSLSQDRILITCFENHSQNVDETSIAKLGVHKLAASLFRLDWPVVLR